MQDSLETVQKVGSSRPSDEELNVKQWVGRLFTKNTKMDEKIMQEISDKEDADLTLWERQLRVNQYMLDFNIKQQMQELLLPVSDSIHAVNEQLELAVP